MSDSFTTPWTVTCWASLSVGFPRQKYWSGLPFPSPGTLSHPGIDPMSPPLQEDSLQLSHQGSPGEYDTAFNQTSEGCRLEKRFEKCVHRGGPGDLRSGSEKEGRHVENSQLSERG